MSFSGLFLSLVLLTASVGFAFGDTPTNAPTSTPTPVSTPAATAPSVAPAPVNAPQSATGQPHHPKEPPTFADVAYGPDPKQKLDIYLPDGSGPFPVILMIHGGGWFAGDKIGGAGEPATWTKQGAAVVSIEYRFIDDAVREGISPPIAAPLLDARRALQFIRYHAADYKLNADKIVVTGFSAGGSSSLFLAVEGEQANPNSPDPIERVSTKITAALPAGAPTSFDPKQMDEWNPTVKWGFYLFEPDGKTYNSLPDYEKFVANRDKWVSEYQKYSPDYLVSKDAPPIWLSYNEPLPPLGEQAPPWKHVHSPLWGIPFQKLALERGVGECYLEYPGHPVEKFRHNGYVFMLYELGLGKP